MCTNWNEISWNPYLFFGLLTNDLLKASCVFIYVMITPGSPSLTLTRDYISHHPPWHAITHTWHSSDLITTTINIAHTLSVIVWSYRPLSCLMVLFTIITKLVSSSKSIFSQLQTHEHLKLFISLPLFQLVPVCVCVCALSTGSISKKLKISNNVYSHPQQSAILLLTWSTIVFLLINTLFELYLVSWSFQSERDMQYDFWNVYRSGLL